VLLLVGLVLKLVDKRGKGSCRSFSHCRDTFFTELEEHLEELVLHSRQWVQLDQLVQVLRKDLLSAPVSTPRIVESLHDLCNVILADFGRNILQENVQVLEH